MGLTRPGELPMRWVDYGGHPKQDMKGIVVQVKKAGEGHIMLLGENASAYAQIHDIMSVQNISTQKKEVLTNLPGTERGVTRTA